jgi:predicted PurR-regulated permease PerM
MLEPVFQFLEKFVTDFSWKRLALFLSFLSLIVFVVVAYEWYTSSYELTKYQTAVAILKELEPLVKSGSMEISEPAKHISSNILEAVQNRGIANAVELTFSPRTSQAIFAGLPWLLFLFLFVPSLIKKEKEDVYNGIIGCVFFGFIAAGIAALVPTDWSNWLRYGLPHAVTLILLAVAAYFGNKS